MSIPSPETERRIAQWREKIRSGTITRDDMREAVAYLRADRAAAPIKTTASKAAKAEVDTAGLLGQLGIKF